MDEAFVSVGFEDGAGEPGTHESDVFWADFYSGARWEGPPGGADAGGFGRHCLGLREALRFC